MRIDDMKKGLGRMAWILALTTTTAACVPNAESRPGGEDDPDGDAVATVDEYDESTPERNDPVRDDVVRDDNQNDEPVRESADLALVVPTGSTISLTLDQRLGTDESEAGDRFSATVSQQVRVADEVAIPAGSRLDGTVTAVQQQTDERPGVIKLAVESMTIGTRTYAISGEVSDVTPEVESSQSTGEAAAKVGVTTAAGAILGRVIGGNSTGTIIGAAVGAAAGTAIVLTTDDAEAVLPAGSPMQITLDAPLTVERSTS